MGVRLKAGDGRICRQEAGVFEGRFALGLVQNGRTAWVSALKMSIGGVRGGEKIFWVDPVNNFFIFSNIQQGKCAKIFIFNGLRPEYRQQRS